MGKGDKRRPQQVSNEEADLRWQYYKGRIDITEEELNERIEKIRKRTKKP